jgi:3-phosphoshikimate 1-carboxyvinyltransferase
MRALRKWSPSNGPNNPLKTTLIPPIEDNPMAKPPLPPSKSHLIRWAMMAALNEKKTMLRFEGIPGEDAESMRRCLIQMGAEIEPSSDGWQVRGGVFRRPISVLHCGNSATALRLLAIQVASLAEPVMLDGDANLRARDHSPIVQLLRDLGVEVSQGSGPELLPLLIKGPISNSSVKVDVSMSSQPLSALILASHSLNQETQVETTGKQVSQAHGELSKQVGQQCGMPEFSNTLNKWNVNPPSEVKIPADSSLLAFIHLFNHLHASDIPIELNTKDLLYPEVLDSQIQGKINLSTANDLITPIAALMCLKTGGEITGVAHARYKESNRIEKTVEMLKSFGLEAEATADGLRMEGGQEVAVPTEIVACFGDHRMFMTAAVLATKVGAELDSPGCYRVSWPEFSKLVQMK